MYNLRGYKKLAVEITYKNYKVKNDDNHQETIESFARDISWGTFVDDLKAIEFISDIQKKVKVYEPTIEPKFTAVEKKEFKLVFRDDVFNFESEGIDHFIGTVAGDVLLYRNIETIEVADFNFTTDKFKNFFKGPNVGIEKLYTEFLKKTLKGVKRPIIAYSVKPRMGMTVEDYKKIYKEAAKGGIDIIEDDERLIDPIYCPFNERINAMAEVQSKYGTKFSANITGPIFQMIKRLIYAHKKGIEFVKIDVMVTGFDALKIIANFIRVRLNSEVAITCYPDANGMYRKLSREFILKMARLCGADIIYTSTPQWARMDDEFNDSKFKENIHDIERKLKYHTLLSMPIANFPNLKSTLPSISNGCNISQAELIQFIYRKEFNEHYMYAYFVGGGISGFPVGLQKNVKEWISCLEYTANKDLKKNDNYNYKYRKLMEENGIELHNIGKELGL